MRFVGKSVFVTGGARGIGLATAEAFAGEGAVVTLADRDGDVARDAAARIGADMLGIGCDVSDRASVAAALSAATARFGGIDILFNNAGLHTRRYNSPVTMVSEADWEEMLRVNILGTVNCATFAAPYLKARGGGVIINNSSVSGYEVSTAYGVTKLAVRGVTVALAAELAGQGTRVNAVAPGLIHTDTVLGDLSPEHAAGFVEERQLLKRPAVAGDVTGAVLFLSSDEAGFITGETLMVGGGFARHV